MSVFNGEKWLRESIDSILRQSYREFEFLVIDDGSSDNSARIANEAIYGDERARIIRKPNTGLTDSLNFGLGIARGDWIARIDADDIAESTRLESQLAAVQSNGCSLIGSDFRFINERGEIVGAYHYPTSHSRLVTRFRHASAFFPHSSALFNRAKAIGVGGYRQRLRRAQDLDLWLRLAEIGRVCSLPAPLVRIRCHASQVSHEDGGKRQQIDAISAVTSHYLRLEGQNDPLSPSISSSEFERFHGWIGRQLEAIGWHSRLGILRSHNSSRSGKRFGKVLNLVSAGLKNPRELFQFANNHIRRGAILRQLAMNWIENSTTNLSAN
jgi:GT2 family glycosyltransferase